VPNCLQLEEAKRTIPHHTEMEFWSFPSSLRSLLAPNRVNFLNTLTAICEICCRQSAGKWENNNKTRLVEKTKFTSRINRGAHKSMLQNGNSFRCVSVCVCGYTGCPCMGASPFGPFVLENLTDFLPVERTGPLVVGPHKCFAFFVQLDSLFGN